MKQLYRNTPQLKAMLVSANKSYHVLGRGVGKTSGILADSSSQNILQMPGLSGMNIGPTYSMQLTRTLPSLIAGWTMLGYKRDVHYVIGKRPPASWRWKDPFEAPVKYDYYIHWINGAGMHLGSQDIDGSTIGLNFQWIQGDEAKKLNVDKLNEEVRPAMRGYKHLFGHLPNYRSECYTTSMPVKATEKWILAEREKMNPELVNDILFVQLKINELQSKLLTCSVNQFGSINQEIKSLTKFVNELRRDCVFYQEASSLENYAILGKEYFDDLYRNLPPLLFDVEILNIRDSKISGGFYPTFDINKHTYPGAFHNTYLESLNYDLDKISNVDCRQDADLVDSEPLVIAIDWGAHMNFMSVAQHIGNKYRFINEVYVKHPEHIDHLAEKFAKYYLPHYNKDIIFLMDVTGDNKKENSSETNAEQFMNKVKSVSKSFRFIKRPRTAAPTHELKFKQCYFLLQGNRLDLPQVLINEDKCAHLIVSVKDAPLKKDDQKGIQKDKSSEKRPDKIDPLDATHASDTFDIHVNHIAYVITQSSGEYIGDLL